MSLFPNKPLLYIDFETAWESKKGGYGLRQMSMVEYIRDSRFKAFGMGVAANNQPIEWISGSRIPNFCSDVANGIGWPNITLVGHNLKFDASILRHVYDCVPGEFRDTKAMSKGVLGKSVKSHSLMDLALYFGLVPKGTMKTDGLRELTKEQEIELADYCLHDVRLCREIYKRLAKDFPENQYPYVNWTIESFVSPKLELNTKLLENTNEKEKERRENIFTEIGIEKGVFASNKKFSDLLKEKDYEVPTKVSTRTGKTIPALALGDTEFIELSENGNEELKKLCEARIAAKSTLLETRSLKLANISKTGRWPFDIEYSGADQTHRFSGGSGAGGNPQNFTRGSALRDAVQAPEGYSLVVGDFSNIELRLVAYLSKDPGLIGAIERGSDIYCDFASAFYKRKITKQDAVERMFGKTAILGLGYGMGAKKFAKTVKIKTGHAIPQEEAQAAVDLYRTLYSRVPATWEKLHNTISRLTVDHWGKLLDMPVMTGKECILLPSGLRIKFMNLRQEDKEWTFDVYSKKNLEQRRLYGGKLLENLCQALAGEITKEAAIQFGDQLTGLVHDELHVVCKKGLELVTKQKMQKVMTTSPAWMPQIKLECEIGVGQNWGLAK